MSIPWIVPDRFSEEVEDQGPHDVDGHLGVESGRRLAVSIIVVVKDRSTGDIMHRSRLIVTEMSAGSIEVIDQPLHFNGSAPWSVLGIPQTTITAVLSSGNLFVRATLPTTGSFEIAGRIEGISA